MAGGGKGDRAGINTSYVKKIMEEQLYIHLNTAVARASSEGRRKKSREREKERRERWRWGEEKGAEERGVGGCESVNLYLVRASSDIRDKQYTLTSAIKILIHA